MQRKIIYTTATIVLLLSVLFVLSRLTKSNHPIEGTKIDTTYSTGKTQQLYKKGKDSTITETKTFHDKTKITTAGNDSIYTYTKKDSLYNLTINIKPARQLVRRNFSEVGSFTTGGAVADTNSFLLDYFLDIKSKNLFRVDTIYQIRVDTLKIKEVITKIIKPPFYNTFWFGAVVTGTVLLILLNIIN